MFRGKDSIVGDEQSVDHITSDFGMIELVLLVGLPGLPWPFQGVGRAAPVLQFPCCRSSDSLETFLQLFVRAATFLFSTTSWGEPTDLSEILYKRKQAMCLEVKNYPHVLLINT